MKIYNYVWILLLLAPSTAIADFYIKDVSDELMQLQKQLGPLLDVRSAHIDVEINKLKANPMYQLNYRHAESRQGLIRIIGEILMIKRRVITESDTTMVNCSESIADYRASTFEPLVKIYDQYVSDDTRFDILFAPVVMANSRDTFKLFASMAMTCGQLRG